MIEGFKRLGYCAEGRWFESGLGQSEGGKRFQLSSKWAIFSIQEKVGQRNDRDELRLSCALFNKQDFAQILS